MNQFRSRASHTNNNDKHNKSQSAQQQERPKVSAKIWLYQSWYRAQNKMDNLVGIVNGLTGRVQLSGDAPEPLFLFGHQFHLNARALENVGDDSAASDDQETCEERFHRHFRSILWLTYRRNFFPMQPPSSYTSDTGWGCMLRSAQMILAQTLQRHFFGDQWNVHEDRMIIPANNKASALSLKERRRHLLQWFVDAPKLGAFYSIHRMTQCGVRYGKQPGEWYGPTTVALVLRDLVASHAQRGRDVAYKNTEHGDATDDEDCLDNDLGQTLSMIVADDGTVYVNEVLALCEAQDSTSSSTSSSATPKGDDPLLAPRPPPEWHSSIFILMPLRLGLEILNPEYLPPLLQALRFPQCVGMIGGKPAHSLFFVGSQADGLIYLDPHTVQPAAVERPGTDSDDQDDTGDDHTCPDEQRDNRVTGQSVQCCPAANANAPTTNEQHSPPPRRKFVSKESYILPTDDELNTYHCSDAKIMPARNIDPSLALGFFCSNRQEFDNLCTRIEQLKSSGLPVLNVMMDRPNYDNMFDEDVDDEDGLERTGTTGSGPPPRANNGEQDHGGEDDDLDLDRFHDSIAMNDATMRRHFEKENVGQKESDSDSGDFVLL